MNVLLEASLSCFTTARLKIRISIADTGLYLDPMSGFLSFSYLSIKRGLGASNIREFMTQISLGEEKKKYLWDKEYVVCIKGQ